MQPFTESQQFRQWWAWVVIGFTLLAGLVPLFMTSAWHEPIAWLTTSPVLMIVGLLYIWRLDTRLDAAGIHYRVFPIIPWRTIPWKAIKSASIHQYSFVGYGIRWGFDGWVYNVAGDTGLRVLFPNDRQLTIGTRCPDEVQRYLDHQSVFNS